MSRRILLAVCFSVLAGSASGHSGGTDRRGGHNGPGGYHFHNGGSGGGGGFSGGGGSGWVPHVYVQPRRDPPTRAQREARTAYRDKVRTDDARRLLAAAQAEAEKRAAMGDGEERERRAQAKLRLAKDLIAKGHATAGVKWLKEILVDFPETNAAVEARKILENQGINLGVWYGRMRGAYGLLAQRRSWLM